MPPLPLLVALLALAARRVVAAQQAAATGAAVGPAPPRLPPPGVASILQRHGLSTPAPWAFGTDPSFGFVRAAGAQLVTGDAANGTRVPVYLVGANAWHAAWLGASDGGVVPGADRARLSADLDALQSAGVTFVRVVGASDGPDDEPWRASPAMRPCLGAVNEAVMARAEQKDFFRCSRARLAAGWL